MNERLRFALRSPLMRVVAAAVAIGILGAATIQTYLAPMTVPTMADLMLVNPSPKLGTVRVLGYTAAGQWPGGKEWRVVLTNSATTNALQIRFPANTNWMALHDWGGDAEVFGLREAGSSAENTAAISNAMAVAVSRGIRLKLPRGNYDFQDGIVITSSNTDIEGNDTTLWWVNNDSSKTNNHEHSMIRTLPTFRPFVTNGGHGPLVNVSLTNIRVANLKLRVKPGSFSTFGVSLFGHSGGKIEGINVRGLTNHYAFSIFGNNTVVTGNDVDNQGVIYQDTVHLFGGTNTLIEGNILRSGDDTVAISPGTHMDVEVRTVGVVGNITESSHAHAFRVFIENPSATNRVRDLVFSGNVGGGGLRRNGSIRISSASTNVQRLIGNVHINASTLYTGNLASHIDAGVTNLAYGVFIGDCEGCYLNGLEVGTSVLEGIHVEDSDRVYLTDCKADGAEFPDYFNTTVRVDNVGTIVFQGGRYQNRFTNGFSTILLSSVDKAEFYNVYISNRTAAGNAIAMQTNGSVARGAYVKVEDSVIETASVGLYAQAGAPGQVIYNNNIFNCTTPALITNTTVVRSWGNGGTFLLSTNEIVRGALQIESTLTALQNAVIGQNDSTTSLEVKGGNSGAAIIKLTRTNQPQIGLISSDGMVLSDLRSNWVNAAFNAYQHSVEWRAGSGSYSPASHGRGAARPFYLRGEQATGTDIAGERFYIYLPNGTGAGSTGTNALSVFAPVAGASGATAQTMREVFRARLTTGAGYTGTSIEDDAGTLRPIRQGAAGTGPGGAGRALFTD